MVDIEQRKLIRARLMNAVFDKADGSQANKVDARLLANEQGVSEEEANSAFDYLEGEGLVDVKRAVRRLAIYVFLTHRGIVEVEAGRDSPDRDTEHFPAYNVILVQGDVVNSPIQQGSPGAQQTVEYNTAELAVLAQFVSALRRDVDRLGLSADEVAELQDEASKIEVQLGSSTPKTSRLRASALVAKEILVSAAGSAASAGLLELLAKVRL